MARLAYEDAWHSFVTDDRNRWADPDADTDFWADHAESYEERFVGEPEGLSVLESVLKPTDSVLEIGPGTGRYTREIATRAEIVTAVDDAPAMRSVLESNLERAGVAETVDIVPEPWEETTVDSHDVVFAAWSLYRQSSLTRCLERILEVADRAIVLVDSVGERPPHRRLAQERSDDEGPTPPPRHVFYSGLLADRGIYPDVHIETAARQMRAPNKAQLLEDIVGDTVADPQAYADELEPWLEVDGDGWRYRYSIPVSICVWEESA